MGAERGPKFQKTGKISLPFYKFYPKIMSLLLIFSNDDLFQSNDQLEVIINSFNVN